MTRRAKATPVTPQWKRQYAQEIKWLSPHKAVRHKYLAKVRSFKGAKVSCMVDNVQSTLQDDKPDHTIQHTDANDLRNKKTSVKLQNLLLN